MDPCRLCPRRCGAKRLHGETGTCGAGSEARLASATVHCGEEPPISGSGGSATFFFSNCPLSCLFCQNYPISQLGIGRAITTADLAKRMLLLARRGAHNINIVTGTQYAPHIAEAVATARRQGLALPVAWNTSGYETPETLLLLDSFVDIYLTDIKYADDKIAVTCSDAPGYWRIATDAARQMIAQVGPLQVDDQGIATRGVIIRHLVLPDGLAGTAEVMKFIASELAPDVPVSLMGQFFPAYRAPSVEILNRRLTAREYDGAKQAIADAKIDNGWFQVEPEASESYTAVETNLPQYQKEQGHE